MDKKRNLTGNRRSLYWLGALLVSLSLLVSACVQLEPGSPSQIDDTPESQATAPIEVPTETVTPVVVEIPPTESAPKLVPIEPVEPIPAVTGEAPAALLVDIRADLAALSGAAAEEMVVIRDQAVTWSDGSLGCPQPGMMYTQALVPGYWVVVQVGEQEYDYRASQSGYFLLCENGDLPFSLPVDR